MTKKCSRCKQDKTGGHKSLCTECRKAYDREYYQKHRKKQRASRKASDKRCLDKTQHLLLEYWKDHPCVDCGEDDPRVLTFDHRNPTEKEQNISDMMRNRCGWKRIAAEIEKCDVRCANCHARKTAVERGYFTYTMCR